MSRVRGGATVRRAPPVSDQRVTWYAAVHDAFVAANVDGCAWAYTNTMPLRDPVSNAWIAQLLGAIGL